MLDTIIWLLHGLKLLSKLTHHTDILTVLIPQTLFVILTRIRHLFVFAVAPSTTDTLKSVHFTHLEPCSSLIMPYSWLQEGLLTLNFLDH